jgi:hypothetical protein
MVTAGGGVTVKKNFAWSAGAVRNESAASITARTAASFGFRNSEINPAIGSTNPTAIKNPAKARVRKWELRVSNPSGVNRKPRTIPTTNKTASIRSVFPKDDFENMSYSPN